MICRDQIEVAAACGLDADEHIAEAQARHHEAATAQHRVLLGYAPQAVDRGLVVGRQTLEVLQVVGQRQALANGARRVGIEVVGDAAHEFGDQGIAALGQCTGGIAGLAQGLQDDHGRRRRVQPHAVGQARIVVRVVGQDQRDALGRVGLAAQQAPAARQVGHEGNALELGLVVHHVDLGVLAAPRQALEADGAADDSTIDLGHHHLHCEVARRQAVRVGQPLFVRATGGDELQHRGISGQRTRHITRSVIGAVERGHRKAGRVQHHRHRVLCGQRLQQGQAGRVLQRVHRQRQRVQAGIGQRREHGVEHRRVAGLQVGTVEHQQRGRCAGSVARRLGQRPIEQRRRQHRRGRRSRAEAKGCVADQREEGLRVVAPAFAQAAPELAAIVGGGGASQQKLRIFAGVAGEHRQPLATLARQCGRALHHVSPVARAAQVVDDHHAGVAQHVVHVYVGGRGLAQPHQVGQAHWRMVGAQAGGHIGQQRQHGVGRAQHDDRARRLRHAHDALTVVFDMPAWAGGEQVHQLTPATSPLTARAAAPKRPGVRRSAPAARRAAHRCARHGRNGYRSAGRRPAPPGASPRQARQ